MLVRTLQVDKSVAILTLEKVIPIRVAKYARFGLWLFTDFYGQIYVARDIAKSHALR